MEQLKASSIIMNSEDSQYYKNIVTTFYNLHDKNDIPWLKPHLDGNEYRDIPHDPITGAIHRNLNGVYLDMVSQDNQYTDPRWISLGSVYENPDSKLHVKEYMKPTLVKYSNQDNSLTYYNYVYNCSQIEGIPEYVNNRNDQMKSVESLRETLKNNYTQVFSNNHNIESFSELSKCISKYYLAIETKTPYIPNVNEATYIKNIADSKYNNNLIIDSIRLAMATNRQILSVNYDRSVSKSIQNNSISY